MSKVSIIIPSYNVIDYIQECIQSVLNQTMRDIEIICVDASSTDGTAEVIDEFSKRDRRIRFISCEKKSYGKQVNVGIMLAQSDYIGIVESDDYIEPDMFASLYKEAIRNGSDVVKGQFWFEYPRVSGARIREEIQYIPNEVGREVIICKTEDKIHKWDSFIWNGIYRKQFLLDNQISFSETEGAAYQDIGFQNKVLCSASTICYMRKRGYNYRIARIGASSINPKCLFFLCYEYNKLFNDWLIKDEFRGAIYEKMTSSFFRELKKTLALHDSFEDWIRIYRDPFKWFLRELKEVNSYDVEHPGSLSPQLRRDLTDFLADPLAETKELISKAIFLKKWLRENHSSLFDPQGIILFGFGRYGGYMRSFCWRNGIKILAIMDNNCEKWGRKIGSVEVMDPCVVLRNYPNAYIYIPVKNGSREIMEQLVGTGADPDKVYAFEDDEVEIPLLMKYFQEISIMEA